MALKPHVRAALLTSGKKGLAAILAQLRMASRAVRRLQPAPSPYVDYARAFLADGSVVIYYKDLDQQLWRTVLRSLLWLAATGLALRYALYYSPLGLWLGFPGVLIMAGVNWLILFSPVEVLRTISVRPDCMMLDGKEVFWRSQMEMGFPAFAHAEGGHLVMRGIYGTRHVDYLTVRRFDPLDRTPELLVQHFNEALTQQWIGRAHESV